MALDYKAVAIMLGLSLEFKLGRDRMAQRIASLFERLRAPLCHWTGDVSAQVMQFEHHVEQQQTDPGVPLSGRTGSDKSRIRTSLTTIGP